ncbi:putative coiled-coil domain-containing protein 94 [Monocercomonoides exilis]|uniref:putative coiled-coil domain-containing protein 94 n=1 Tax=Monocercomonoides exilis TaxID=2049356 RepID=UPI00355A17F9|nr:putative coiled-coil domain-containing protein 94 [Monocercomonoides exilis]|eukprot:MONOS_13592.1-p1 / transcript=MONOS_13592.1 / gene=MONOS_13592 / organism=Monocercomonoides_exilis_PA203 / gene_product=coiled-coil domain-containing protein 94 / transcript_product=coiled-coil domain-containing protein 94 / location=Mono_scaffold00851:1314-5008(-) / protein_length=1033 / sequence_SO=supercontig / SO=protein_coding / is_pseudo=false
MAERKAMQKYYPPEWTPKDGSLNKFHGQHPLRQRASKLKTEGILVIRFEIPFNMWCEECGCFIAQGTRFNAEKKTVGSYLSTKILSFKMNCDSCHNEIEIQTDPQHQRYVVTKGGKQKSQDFDAADAETMMLSSVEERIKLKTDALYALEHFEEDKKKALEDSEAVGKMLELMKTKESYFDLNESVRKRFRKVHRDDKDIEKRNKIKSSFRLLPSSADDEEAGKNVVFKHKSPSSQLPKSFRTKSMIHSFPSLSHHQSSSQPSTELESSKSKSLVPPSLLSSTSQSESLLSLAPSATPSSSKSKSSSSIISSLFDSLSKSSEKKEKCTNTEDTKKDVIDLEDKVDPCSKRTKEMRQKERENETSKVDEIDFTDNISSNTSMMPLEEIYKIIDKETTVKGLGCQADISLPKAKLRTVLKIDYSPSMPFRNAQNQILIDLTDDYDENSSVSLQRYYSPERNSDQSVGRNSITYGEMRKSSVQQIINEINALSEQYRFKEDSVFVDIGSGLGKIVFHAFLSTPSSECWGVEIVRKRNDFAESMKPKLMEILEKHDNDPDIVCLGIANDERPSPKHEPIFCDLTSPPLHDEEEERKSVASSSECTSSSTLSIDHTPTSPSTSNTSTQVFDISDSTEQPVSIPAIRTSSPLSSSSTSPIPFPHSSASSSSSPSPSPTPSPSSHSFPYVFTSTPPSPTLPFPRRKAQEVETKIHFVCDDCVRWLMDTDVEPTHIIMYDKVFSQHTYKRLLNVLEKVVPFKILVSFQTPDFLYRNGLRSIQKMKRVSVTTTGNEGFSCFIYARTRKVGESEDPKTKESETVDSELSANADEQSNKEEQSHSQDSSSKQGAEADSQASGEFAAHEKEKNEKESLDLSVKENRIKWKRDLMALDCEKVSDKLAKIFEDVYEEEEKKMKEDIYQAKQERRKREALRREQRNAEGSKKNSKQKSKFKFVSNMGLINSLTKSKLRLNKAKQTKTFRFQSRSNQRKSKSSKENNSGSIITVSDSESSSEIISDFLSDDREDDADEDIKKIDIEKID